MKLFLKVMGVLWLSIGLLGASSVAHATTKKREVSSKAAARTESAQKKSSSKSDIQRKTSAAKPVSGKNAAGKAPVKAAANTCKTVRVKTAKGVRSQRSCATAAPAEPLLTSNVDGSALTKPAPEKEPEIKARTVPERAYAVDGETFFFQGRKFRVQGFSGESGSEMAKQRLQKALDSGTLMVDPVSVDASGAAVASVRVNGRSLEDLLAQP